MNRRPDLDGVVFGEEFLDVWIAIVGRGAEIVAKFGVRIGEEDREIVLTFVVDEDRLIVGDEFRE
jgi:hypothetical protein